MKVLVALDGSDDSKAVVEEVLHRTWPEGTEIEVLSVAHAIPAIPDPAFVGLAGHLESLDHERKIAHHVVESATTRIEFELGSKVKVHGEILEGGPTKRILEEAERWGADLILLGSHGRGRLARLVMGSVSHAVVLHAHCSVEVVRAPRKASAA